MKIAFPYLLFTGDADLSFGAKTAQGVLYWRPEQCLGQCRLPQGEVDLGIPFMSLREAYDAGARTLLLGVTNRGGFIPPSWAPALLEALETGFDLASGMHDKLADQDRLRETAARCGRQLHDVRHWSGAPLPLATGARRSGKRVLMVGTDCAVGKKFSALAIDRTMRELGLKSTFRATGQTGILIAGDGIAIDAVPGDFIAGAVEMITPANAPNHWDVIEGQASVLHPSYGGVTLGLVHGAQPDALVVCHEPGRPHVRGLPNRAVPDLNATMKAHLAAAHVTNPDVRIAGVCLDTHRLSDAEASTAIAAAADATGLVVTDPIRFGAESLIGAIVGAADSQAISAGSPS